MKIPRLPARYRQNPEVLCVVKSADASIYDCCVDFCKLHSLFGVRTSLAWHRSYLGKVSLLQGKFTPNPIIMSAGKLNVTGEQVHTAFLAPLLVRSRSARSLADGMRNAQAH